MLLRGGLLKPTTTRILDVWSGIGSAKHKETAGIGGLHTARDYVVWE